MNQLLGDDDDAPLFLGDEICEDEPKEPAITDNGVQNHSRCKSSIIHIFMRSHLKNFLDPFYLVSPNDDQGSTGSSDHSSHKQELREDPEVIKIWKEEQAIMLEAKDREEERAKLALKQQVSDLWLNIGYPRWFITIKYIDFGISF
jgi:hypothetical protein